MNEPFRKIRIGMIGGGPDAFIGEVHRLAARMDNRFELLQVASVRIIRKVKSLELV